MRNNNNNLTNSNTKMVLLQNKVIDWYLLMNYDHLQLFYCLFKNIDTFEDPKHIFLIIIIVYYYIVCITIIIN